MGAVIRCGVGKGGKSVVGGKWGVGLEVVGVERSFGI